MKNENHKRFEGELSPGSPLELKLRDGSTLTARMEYDDSGFLPWKENDGHGIVSDWRRLRDESGNSTKAPGERILCTDDHNRQARFYDVEASIKKAREEDWNAEPYEPENDTPGKRAVRAVEADFQNLRAFCEDRWGYFGVVLDHETRDGYEKKNVASLWGIEYGDGCDDAYPTIVANELLSEVDDEIDLSACEHDDGEDCMNCTECGRCSESLDCEDTCTDCGGHDCETEHPGTDSVQDVPEGVQIVPLSAGPQAVHDAIAEALGE